MVVVCELKKDIQYFLPTRTTEPNNAKQYAPFITFLTCVGVHFCRCNTAVVKALYWIIFREICLSFSWKGWKSFFTPPGCLLFAFWWIFMTIHHVFLNGLAALHSYYNSFQSARWQKKQQRVSHDVSRSSNYQF